VFRNALPEATVDVPTIPRDWYPFGVTEPP
jgi:hypothetical protein